MPAFRGKRPMLLPIPVETSFTQTSPSGDHCRIPLGFWRALVQDDKIFRGKRSGTVGIRFEIVDEPHRGEPKLLGQALGIYHPRQINGLTATVVYRSRDAKTGMHDMQVVRRDKRADNVVKTSGLTT